MTGDELKTIKECADAALIQRQGLERVLNGEPDLKLIHHEILSDIIMGLAISREKLNDLI